LDFEHFNGTGEFDYVSAEEIAEHEFDFKFTLQEIIDTQKELI